MKIKSVLSKIKKNIIGRLTGDYYAVYEPSIHEELESCPTCGKLVTCEE